jgi:hypothetical protein
MSFNPLRKLFIAVFVLGFAALYLVFLWKIYKAEDGIPPVLDEVWLGVAAILSGALGSAFALALGLEDSRTKITLAPPDAQWFLVAGIYLYGLVGLLALLVYLFNTGETPGSIAALALGIVGYGAAIITNAYRAVLPHPPPPPD